MGCPGEAIQGHKSRQWTARRERERGGGERSDEAVAMLPRGGWVADGKTRGGGAEGVARGELEADDWTRGGGRTMRGKWAADDRSSQQEGGGARRSQRRQWRWQGRRQLVVGGWGRTTIDAGNGSTGNIARLWGVGDADNAPKAVCSGGGGEPRRRRRSGHWSGGAASNDGATTAMATTIAVMTTLAIPIAEWDQTTHHWTMVGGRGPGGWVDMCRISQFFLLSICW